MIPQILIAAAIAGISAAGAWSFQEARYGKQIADIHSTHALAFAQAQKDAHDTAARLQADKDEAVRKASARQHALARDLAGARTALVGLSDAADSALRSASNSHSACLVSADAFADVFQQCRGRLVEVGAAADGHASDAQTLIDSWPTFLEN